jgi:DNA invertase Pin-like site-specific DNA recombinase
MRQVWGYARVSTSEQNPALQIDALTAAGVPEDRIVVEKISGAAKVRPLFAELIERLRKGDTLMVWKVDRLGRRTIDALQTAERLTKAGVRIVVTTLGVDLHTPAGRLVFGVLSQIAEFEREQILERINEGIAAARARKKAIGRPHSLNAHQRREAARLIDEGKSYGEVAALFGTGRSVIWDTVQKVRAGAPVNGIQEENGATLER